MPNSTPSLEVTAVPCAIGRGRRWSGVMRIKLDTKMVRRAEWRFIGGTYAVVFIVGTVLLIL